MEVTRAFPVHTDHPRRYMTLTAAEVAELSPRQMESAPSITPGHAGTVVFYTCGEVCGYVVQVKFDRGEPDYFLLPCSWEPKFGIDRFDGMLIQDAEAFSVMKRLRWKCDRLDIFGENDAIDTRTYLQVRGWGSLHGATAPKTKSDSDVAQCNATFAAASGIVVPLISVNGGPPSHIGRTETASLRKAVELFGQVLRMSPQNASAMWLCGKALGLLKEPEQALQLFIKAAEANPAQMQFAVDAELLALQLGRSAEALKWSRRALDCSPNDPELMSNHAFALLISGDAKAAAKLSADALKLSHPSQQITRRVNAACLAVVAKKFPPPKNEADVIKIIKALKV